MPETYGDMVQCDGCEKWGEWLPVTDASLTIHRTFMTQLGMNDLVWTPDPTREEGSGVQTTNDPPPRTWIIDFLEFLTPSLKLGHYIQWTQGPGTGDPGTQGPRDPDPNWHTLYVYIHSTYIVHVSLIARL